MKKYNLESQDQNEAIQAAFAFVDDYLYDRELWVNGQPNWAKIDAVFALVVDDQNVLPITKLAMVRIAHGAAHVKEFPHWAVLRDKCVQELSDKVCFGLIGLEFRKQS